MKKLITTFILLSNVYAAHTVCQNQLGDVVFKTKEITSIGKFKVPGGVIVSQPCKTRADCINHLQKGFVIDEQQNEVVQELECHVE